MASKSAEKSLPSVEEFLSRTYTISLWIQKITGCALRNDKEFYSQIKDGIILCTLLKKVDERLIPRITSLKEGAWKLRENVEFFIDGCDRLGVPRHKLLHVHDLMRLGNTLHVLQCLEALETVLVKERLVSIGKDDMPGEELEYSDEQQKAAKKQIKALQDLRQTKEKRGKIMIELGSLQKRKLDLLTVGIRKPQNYPKFELLQRVTRGFLAREHVRRLKRQKAIRNKVAEEILASEKAYVEQLKTCIKVYLVPLRAAMILSQEDVRTVFGDVELIFNINDDLLISLTAVMKDWNDSTCVGSTFKVIASTLKLYTNYVSNVDKGMRVFREIISKSKEAQQWFDERRTDEDNVFMWDLPAFLIAPVQRIPRYQLLLREMVKYTWDYHPDLKELKEAEAAVKSVGDYMNEKKREAENSEKVLMIQRMMTGKVPPLLSPGRYFVDEGLLNIVLSKKKRRARYFYLFTDILVSTKPQKKKLKREYEGTYSMHNVLFQDIPEFQSIANAFELYAPDHSWRLSLEAPDAATKRRWMNGIISTIEKLEKLQRSDLDDDNAMVPKKSRVWSRRKSEPATHTTNGVLLDYTGKTELLGKK